MLKINARLIFLSACLASCFLIDSSLEAFAPDTSLSVADLTIKGENGGDWAGWSIAPLGDVNGDAIDDLAIGAKENDFNGNTSGQVYVVFGRNDEFPTAISLALANASFLGESPVDRAGFDVTGVGDVNGDGFNDILIGAPDDDDAGENAGQCYLIFGKEDGWQMRTNLADADASFVGESNGNVAGFSMAGVGDVNGDQFDDFIIGAPWNEGRGQVYVILGKESGWEMRTPLANSDASFLGETGASDAGWYVSGGGDYNGDGLADILIGSPKWGGALGQAYIIFGKQDGWTMRTGLGQADASYVGVAHNEEVGWSLSDAGDINGDGFDDILIGAPGDQDIGSSADYSYLVFGRDGGWSQDIPVSQAAAKFIGEDENDESGWNVGGAGDVNGDGFGDFLIGAFRSSANGYRSGKAYLYLGNADGYNGNYDLSIPHGSYIGQLPGDQAGWSVTGVGDINADGFEDFAVGANERENGKGYIYVIFGEDDGYAPIPTNTPVPTPTPVVPPTEPLTITSLSPAPGSILKDAPAAIVANFNRGFDPGTVNRETFKLLRSGGDGVFGNGNDVSVSPFSVTTSGGTVARMNLSGVALPHDTYRVTLTSGGAATALSFDGVDDFVILPNDLIHASTVLTLEVRFKTTSSGAIFGYEDEPYANLAGDFVPAIFVGTDGKLQAAFWDDDHVDGPRPVMGIQSDTPVNDGEWHHVALVGNNTLQRAYLDGGLIGERNAQILHWDMIYNQIGIGQTRFWGQVNGGWFPFNGLIDEVRLWSAARSQEAIQADMNRSLSGSEPDLVAYWNFDEGQGQTAQDSSPNSHHGELGSTSDADSNDPVWTDGSESSEGIADPWGQPLDGEFQGSLPSGDGTPGGNFVAEFILDPDDPPSTPLVHITPAEPKTLDDLICHATGSLDPDGGPVSYAFQWFRDGNDAGAISLDESETSFVDHGNTSRGQVWKCLVTATDDEGQTSTGSDEVTIQNTPPTQPVVRILPDNPLPGDGLAVFITELSTDADGDQIVYLFEWFLLTEEGEWQRRPEVSGNISPFFPGEPEISGLFTALETWRVQVTPLEARTLAKRLQSKAAKAVVSGLPGIDECFILPELVGEDILDIHDLLELVRMYREEHRRGVKQEPTFKGDVQGPRIRTAGDLILISPLGWHREPEN